MKVSCILVHYHAAALALEALRSVREEAARAGVEIEAVVVDNGGEDWERELLRSQPISLLEPGRNLGFAAGVNLGVNAAAGDVLLVLNPDVRLLEGCLGGLLARIEVGAGVAGPKFFWDSEERLVLPPAERRDTTSELLAALAVRGEPWAGHARRRWRRHARRHWEAATAVPSTALPGACLAIAATAWRQTGPMDEGFRLYFEETEWLLRASARGVRCEFVPGARALHEVGRSAERESEAQTWFEESASRFRRQRFGRGLAGLLERVAVKPRPGRSPARAPVSRWRDGGLVLEVPEPPTVAGTAWLEVSPDRRGFPAAGEFLGAVPEVWQPPGRCVEALGGGGWWLRLTDTRGRERAAWRVDRPCG